jgi:hypothetical protein
VAAIAHGKLPHIMEALRDSKIDSQHWVGILQTNSAVAAIAHGKLPDIMEALRDSKIDSQHWVGILQTDSAVAAIGHGKLSHIMEALRNSTIDKRHWESILMSGGAVSAIVRGKFPSLLEQLVSAALPVEKWHTILNSGTTVKAISGDTCYQDYVNALARHGITDSVQVRAIMKNATTTKAIREGHLDSMVSRLESQSETITRQQWYQILSTLASSKALLDDTFGEMIGELKKTTILPKYFHRVLSEPGSSKILREDKSEFHRVLKDLTDSGLHDLGRVVGHPGVMHALLNGCLPRMMVKLRRDHDPTKWYTIITGNNGIKKLCKLECVSIPPACSCTCPPRTSSCKCQCVCPSLPPT